MEYYEYPPEWDRRPMSPGTFLLIFGVITVVLLVILFLAGPYILMWIGKRRLASVTTDYGVPVLSAIDFMTYKDCAPPPGSNMSFFYYNFEITAWDAVTQTGTIKITTYVDLGMQEGTVAFTANFAVDSSNPRVVTISNFNYSRIVGSVLSRMDPGPWTLTLTSGSGAMTDAANVLTLTGRDYANAPITLTKSCS